MEEIMPPPPVTEISGQFSVLPSSDCRAIATVFFPLQRVMKMIIQCLTLRDMKICRLVSRNWNLRFTDFLTFAVTLSDMTMLTFLRIRRTDPSFPVLEISKIIAIDLTSLSAPFTPENLQEQIVRPETVKILQFMEGVSPSVKKTFLLAFKWIETLRFERTPVPKLPEGFILQYVTKFEMSPGAYNESDELQNFFRSTFFPSLTDASIQIHCRGDYGLYASAHYFIARHYQTLRIVKLMFLESLTLINYTDSDAYAPDFQEVISMQRKNLEKQTDYTVFLTNARKLQLDTLSLWLIDNEEFLTLSLKLVNFQKNLTCLDINQPYGYRNTYSDFSVAITSNCSTLRKITIPRMAQFDCAILKNCMDLHEFSLGMEFHFYDFENFGNVINVRDFPCTPKLHTISIGSPMLKTDINWMSENVPAKTLMFIGAPQEEYSLKDIKLIVQSCSKNKKSLMMCVSMSNATFKLFQAYLNRQSNISVRVIYHCQPSELNPGTAHFSLCFDPKNQLSSFMK